MKQYIVLLIACLLLCLPASAQTKKECTLMGTVADSISGAGLPYTTVRLLPAKGKDAVSVCASNEQGQFELSAAAGSYRLHIAGLGLKTKELPVELKAGKNDVGTILVSEDAEMLEAATVTAARPIVTSQIDRLSYSMADDPDAQQSTMIDMLRKVPLVTVDGQDNIQVNGKSSFKIYVNGKPNKMMSDNPSIVLKSFPASVVKKVEVITDPGAKYDAEGVSGILNIVTETEAETSGYTITPNLSWDTDGYRGNLFAMAQFGKLTLSVNGGINHQSDSKTTTDNSREVFADPINHYLDVGSEGHGSGTFGFGSFEASYEFSKHDLLTASTDFFVGRMNNDGDEHNVMRSLAGDTLYAFSRDSRIRNHFNNINASVDYQHSFDKEDQMLTFSYRFSSGKNEQKTASDYSNLFNVPAYLDLRDMRSDPDGSSSEHTAQVDFTTPIGKLHTLSVGAKYIYRLNSSENEELTRPTLSDEDYTRDDARSLSYRHRNNIAAGYGEYKLTVGKFSLRSGVRFESSHVRVSYPDGKRPNFSTTLNDFVPSLNLGYQIGAAQTLRATYNMRIGRPDITYLSPYVNHSSAVSISYGNPNLTSEKAHNFSLNYGFFTPKLSLNATASYSVTSDGLTSYSFLDSDGILNTTYAGYLHSKQLSFDIFANWMIVKQLTWMFSGSLNYGDYKVYHPTLHRNHGYSGRFFTMLRSELPWKIKLNVGGGHNWGQTNLQGRGGSFTFYFASLSRSFLKDDRLTVSLGCFNPFTPRQTFGSTMETADFSSRDNFTIHGFSRFSVGVSWRFGSLKASVKKTARSIENTDVKQAEASDGQGSAASATSSGQVGM